MLVSRLRWLHWLPPIIFGLLGMRLWQLQIVRGSELRQKAAQNRFAIRELEADRGIIYDRAGRRVVLNRPQFALRIVPAALPADAAARDQVLRRVAEVLTASEHHDAVGDRSASTAPAAPSAEPDRSSGAGGPSGSGSPTANDDAVSARQDAIWRLLLDDEGNFVATWSALTVARNVPRQAAFALMEDEVELPGVLIGESSVREYPAGPSLAHLLGFTGSIPRETLGEYLAKNYQRQDAVGRTGVEYAFEADLRGTKGEKVVMVDATGQEVQQLEQRRRPVPGHSLHLTLDLEFQQLAEAALSRGLHAVGARSGAVVALDPRDGAVRALVSLPTYDNNLFSTGASPEQYEALVTDPDRPLLDRALSGQYPPGSTFKVITASAGLQEGVIDERRRIVCPGLISVVNQYDPGISYPYVCWILGQGAHGAQDVRGAIANSCDVFFYEVAGGQATGRPEVRGLGSETLARYARAFGLGAPTGIDLLGEAEGLVPSADWLKETWGETWTTGQTYIMGIGQSYTRVTPLQMANVAAAMANGGTLWRPRLVDRVTDADGNAIPGQPEGARVAVIRHVPVAPRHLAAVREGMRGAVTYGTAQSSWTHLPEQAHVAGKTGTAEFCEGYRVTDSGTPEDSRDDIWDCRRTKEGHLLTHAWFIAFAPFEQPEIAVAVLVDGSGLSKVIQGSEVATPIAADVLRAWFHLPAADKAPGSRLGTATSPADPPAGETDPQPESPSPGPQEPGR
jgi:penicillin-binding protein 2